MLVTVSSGRVFTTADTGGDANITIDAAASQKSMDFRGCHADRYTCRAAAIWSLTLDRNGIRVRRWR